jgi:hypothetical protein
MQITQEQLTKLIPLTMLKFIAFLLFSIILSASVFAFEGNIQLIKQSHYDTTYLIFYIKDSKARVDEFNERGQLTKTLLINLNSGNIIALSPALKLFTDVTHHNKEMVSKSNRQYSVIKTSNYKMIEGKKCFQWRVRNRLLDSEITYWVMESDNQMMGKLYAILNSTENYSSISSFYLQIPETNGYVPILAVERNLVWEEKQSMHITSINERKVSGRLFEIPKDYKNLRI